jgi:hypothetical protein
LSLLSARLNFVPEISVAVFQLFEGAVAVSQLGQLVGRSNNLSFESKEQKKFMGRNSHHLIFFITHE